MGGLGVINSIVWNVAVVGKYTWWVASKTDHLWIKWVNQVYIKQQDWFSYSPTLNTSWTWRQICKVKDKLKLGYQNSKWCTNNGNYTPAEGYKWLMGTHDTVWWHKLAWNRMNVPKHSFIVWLAVQGRLYTKDRLLHLGGNGDTVCYLCGMDAETQNHLFFECPFSQVCLDLVNNWLQCCIPKQNYMEWCRGLPSRCLMKKQVIWAGVAALIYLVWMARNRCKFDSVVSHPEVLVKQMKQQLSVRVRKRICTIKHRGSLRWCESVGLV
ncbi:uncharacterized protein LOC141641397 [Silene latifolia]|uniref:uncharacterized protein LOC141641397 n=1 Tax=Silene latifolia TaxID=37657 RepID=UPI003D771F03